ncbi:NiFe hydrogenase [Shewanella sp. Isolate11]|uniref:NiFe hydrogenase n=1 Tax=Shewanella sp. Isolate11 TaxID=2908530 RepID=UPI001EFDACAC|nr:NiFe hydrogenase [Shewanella sp. Isolate11]MCG9696461.1 NiFe hydrogenase [Shewanella sp. Isolate11]
MNTIEFEFKCARPVGLYAQLCDLYLQHQQLDIKIGYQHNCYFIEATAEQEQLEALADAIADDFLISVWLVDSSISLVTEPKGSTQPLSASASSQQFCQRCTPQFGDNQAPEFGNIAFACPHCHGEQNLDKAYQGLTASDLKALSDELITQGKISLAGPSPIQLSLTPIQGAGRPKLLICNPNTLNAQFHLSDQQILALSSIEKPNITARAVAGHPKLSMPLYDLRFAYSRPLIVIAEHLRQRGIDWLYIENPQQPVPLALIDGQWAEIIASENETSLSSNIKALHEQSCVQHRGISYLASNTKHEFMVTSLPASTSQAQPQALSDQEYGLCALHAVNLEHKFKHNSVLVYFSQQHGGQIQTLNSKGEPELFLALPKLPDTGYELYHQLEQTPQVKVLEKFKQAYPDDYLRLLSLKLDSSTDNLTSLWAIAAIVLGLPCHSMNSSDLSDVFIASALSHRSANAQRVDYPLTKGEAHRSLNWCKTLGSLMSFRLADDSDMNKLAFGMHDSLTDYLANWIEHLDQNIGIKAVNIAGDEWSNPLLSQRFSLRVGKNFPIYCNRQLAIDSNNYAMGALLLKKRRK